MNSKTEQKQTKNQKNKRTRKKGEINKNKMMNNTNKEKKGKDIQGHVDLHPNRAAALSPYAQRQKEQSNEQEKTKPHEQDDEEYD